VGGEPQESVEFLTSLLLNLSANLQPGSGGYQSQFVYRQEESVLAELESVRAYRAVNPRNRPR
jgi:hypothetical protein